MKMHKPDCHLCEGSGRLVRLDPTKQNTPEYVLQFINDYEHLCQIYGLAVVITDNTDEFVWNVDCSCDLDHDVDRLRKRLMHAVERGEFPPWQIAPSEEEETGNILHEHVERITKKIAQWRIEKWPSGRDGGQWHLELLDIKKETE